MPADVPTTGPNTKPGERPPVMPLAATKHTPAGAAAFAKFFMLTVDWGYATVSGAYPGHFSAPGCVTCQTLVRDLDSDRKSGHKYIGGRVTIVGVQPGSAGALMKQVITTNSTSFEELTATGKFVTGDPAYQNQRYSVDLNWSGTRWLVEQFRLAL